MSKEVTRDEVDFIKGQLAGLAAINSILLRLIKFAMLASEQVTRYPEIKNINTELKKQMVSYMENVESMIEDHENATPEMKRGFNLSVSRVKSELDIQ